MKGKSNSKLNGENFNIEMVSVEHLSKAEWNYKENDAFMAKKLEENIRRNGILQISIVYEDEHGILTVIDGNHRLDVYRRLKIKTIPCVMLGAIPLNEARRIAIEVNETKFESNRLELAQALHEIRLDYEEEDLKLTLPYTDLELDEFESLIDIEFDKEDESDHEHVEFIKKKKTVYCPKCKHEFKV